MKILLALVLFTAPIVMAVLVYLKLNNKDFPIKYTKAQQKFFDVIHEVESNKAPDGAWIVGKSKELGPMQITYDFWHDAVTFNREISTGRHEHVRHLDYAKEVIDSYFKRYCKDYWSKPEAYTFELAQIYNGGPTGESKLSTYDYAIRVENLYHAN